ncbi:Ammonium transporter NrgA [Pseudobythopirellula maris]|uniref:Ammonium transporter n=1 Tax=Pseudobythopirellula maris TaxID=2527991 RepID=A0A5C5ZGZ7_9BACT|nr:ammonium transporter [Pseudobythopirellula maris]TWT86496.1 Ammonium transporter NrgA [Pseudobythopirellula maris]
MRPVRVLASFVIGATLLVGSAHGQEPVSPDAAADPLAAVEQVQQLLDSAWVLIAAGLVLLMQGGFLCLESGLSRAKNSIHVAIKNLSDFCVSAAAYWAVGFGVMFGASYAGWFGTSDFFLGGGLFSGAGSAWLLAFFLFQITFCGTATTIVSGAVAERMRFGAYLAIAILVSGVLYPLFGHWAWGGVVPGSGAGWLAQMGFIDFAGSTVVHSLGGWVALAAVLTIGPRIGRFGEGATPMNGCNLPMAMLGTLLLWFGWFGFNGGSTLAMNDSVPSILVNTSLSAAFGGLTGLVLSKLLSPHVSVGDTMNGVIAGLVGVTACCHILTPLASVVVGATSCVWCFGATRLLERLRIDDAVGAVPAHGVAGAWGTLCVALLADPAAYGTGNGFWGQLGVQAAGAGVCFVWAFGVGWVALRAISLVIPMRISAADELKGLNIAEHGASTEVLELLTEMHHQQTTGEFSTRVHAEPHTEVGQIAAGYNRVLDKVNEKTQRLEQMHAEAESLHRKLLDVAHQAGKAEIATDVLHNVGNVLNSINVSVGLVRERLEAPRIEPIRKTAQLLREHADDEPSFLADAERGRLVPDYLEGLANALDADNEAAVAELGQLIDNLEHIKAIVSTQQANAGVSGVQEPVDAAQVLGEAETLNASAFDRHGVEVVRQYADLPDFMVEKQKLLQILVNLIRNAKEALVEGRVEGRQLTLRVTRGDEVVRIEVADNGVGVAPENLNKIFTHGFTTKPTGHGFGLHSCANAAREMGGGLFVESEGLGLGTTFLLELPLIPVEAPVAV